MKTSNGREVQTEDLLIEEFTKEVEAIAEQVTLLIQDIQSSKLHFTSISGELNHLISTVKDISHIIRNDDSHKGSLLTRMALLERSIEEIKSYIEKDTISDLGLITRITVLEQKIISLEEAMKSFSKPSVEPKKKEAKSDDDNGKWKFYITLATGMFTLLGTLLAVLIESGC